MHSKFFLGSAVVAAMMTLAIGCSNSESPAEGATAEPAATPATKAVVESDIVQLPEPMKDSDVVVSVGAAQLTWGELSKQVDEILALEVKRAGQPIPSDQLAGMKQMMRRMTVQDFIVKQVMKQTAEANNITLDDAFRAKCKAELETRMGMPFDEMLAASPLSKEEMLARFDDGCLMEKVMQTLVRDKVQVSDEEVAAQVETAQAKIKLVDDEMADYEAQIKAGANFEELVMANSLVKQPIEPPVDALSQIFTPEALAIVANTMDGQVTPILKLPSQRMLVKVLGRKAAENTDDAAAKTKIEELRTRILAGEDFATLAAEFSDCPSGARAGGDLGEFGKGAMVKEFQDAAFTQPVGEVGPVIKTQFGYHIVKVTARDDYAERATASHILIKTGSEPATIKLSILMKQVPPAMTAEQVRQQLTMQRSQAAESEFFQNQMKVLGVTSTLFPELDSAK